MSHAIEAVAAKPFRDTPLAQTPTRPWKDTALGYAVASVCPALFWTLVISGTAAFAGYALPVPTLLAIGFVIAAFLASVFSTIRARAR